MRSRFLLIGSLAWLGCNRASVPAPVEQPAAASPAAAAVQNAGGGPPTQPSRLVLTSEQSRSKADNSSPNATPDGAERPKDVAPLEPTQRKIFLSSIEDRPASKRGGVTYAREDKHYLACNEKTLHAYQPHVNDLGGGYVGVGSDQAYLFIGWTRPEFAWLIDYDQDVVDVHEIYRHFIEVSETPEAMLELWGEQGKRDAVAVLEATVEGDRFNHLKRLYLSSRGWINRRLQAVRRRMVSAKVPSYLSDQETYEYVRRMLETGRVRPMVVNLLEDGGFTGVAQAAKDLGIPIRTLYLSNAEEYWRRYPEQFRANIDALPIDDRSVVLRTLLIWDTNGDYRYNLQSTANFGAWLRLEHVGNVYDVVHNRPKPRADIINFFVTNEDPAGFRDRRKR